MGQPDAACYAPFWAASQLNPKRAPHAAQVTQALCFSGSNDMEDIRDNLKSYKKQAIAMEYLNMALREYVNGRNLFVVINLACAAEEMLGKIVDLNKNENALKRSQRWLRSWFQIQDKDTPPDKELNKQLLKVKNGIKHINGASDLEITLDLDREAKKAIRGAIENFNLIPDLQQSDELLAYYKHEKT